MDFISSEWKSVAQTRSEGQANLFFSGVPLLLVMFYIVVQASEGEYTEMSTAIIALLFSAQHFLRTVWGLWQLRSFRKWAIQAIENLRKVGVNPSKSKHDSDKSAAEIADTIKVNESIVDNQITHGLTICYLHLQGIDLLHYDDKQNDVKSDEDEKERDEVDVHSDNPIPRWKIVMRQFVILSKWIRASFIIVSNLALFPFSSGAGHRKFYPPHQVPKKPISVWIRWSSAFVAQLMPDWVAEFRAVEDPFDTETRKVKSLRKASTEEKQTTDHTTSAKEEALTRGRYFGAELTASATLHLLSCSTDYLDDHAHGGGKTKRPVTMSNPFLWDQWGAEHQKDHMCDGRFTKAEMFNFAVQNTSILPFSCPHKNNLHKLKKLKHMERVSYAPYNNELKAVIAELPVEWPDVEKMEDFDFNKLEWFTVLLHLGQKSTAPSDTDCTSEQIKSNLNREGDIPFGAISNLQKQLNMESDSIINDYALDSSVRTELQPFFNLSAIPIAHDKLTLVSQTNKQVTKVGELIDVWLSLVAGQQIFNMIKQTESSDWETVCMSSSYDFNAETKTSETREVNSELEQQRLDWRVADHDQCYHLMDHYITFMGYRMEFVRSGIAFLHGVFGNDEHLVNSFFGEANWTYVQLRLPDGPYVCKSFSEKHLQNRGLKALLIYEVQNLLEERLDKIWAECKIEDDDETSTPSIQPDTQLQGKRDEVVTLLACSMVLSFPSLSVKVLDQAPTEHGARPDGSVNVRVSVPTIAVIVEAEGGPQAIKVMIQIQYGKALHIRIVGQAKCLEWHHWKEAFLGRLIGFREWGSKHDFKNVPALHACAANHIFGGLIDLETITSQKFTTFSSWVPFRTSFCLFEFKYKDQSLQQIEVSQSYSIETHSQGVTSHHGVLPVRKQIATSYEDAKFSTIAENVIFIDAAMHSHQGNSNSSNEAGSIIAMAREKEEEQFVRSLQLLELTSVKYTSSEALTAYLQLVKDRNEAKYWLSAISTVEGYIQSIIADRNPEIGDVSSELQSLLNPIDHFIIEWGSERKTQNLFNIFVSLCVKGNLDVSERAIDSVKKMLYYTAHSDINIPIRDTLAKCANIAFCHRKRSGRYRTNFQRFFPRYINNNAIKIWQFLFRRDKNAEYIRDGVVLYAKPEDRNVKNCYILRYPTATNVPRTLSFGHLLLILAFNVRQQLSTKPQKADVTINESQSQSTICAPSAHKPTQVKTRGNESIIGHEIRRVSIIYELAMHHGSIHAIVCLANLLSSGAPGVQRNAPRALQLYEQAIETSQISTAMVNLANLLSSGAPGVPKNVSRAMQLYQQAIITYQDIDAMVNQANLLALGAPGVQQNATRAVQLYEHAIKTCQHTNAMNSLANLLSSGAPGVERNAPRAVQLYQHSIDISHNTDAMNGLANQLKYGAPGVQPNAPRAVELYQLAIDNSQSARAMYNLAVLLSVGAPGVQQNAPRAVQLYEQAIDTSQHGDAIYNLGLLLSSGAPGVERNASRAAELYQMAIDTSQDVDAMINLANLLSSGAPDLQRNVQRAIELYQKAIDTSQNAVAMYNIAMLLSSGAPGVQQDAPRAVQLYEKAIDTSQHTSAMTNLANLLSLGAPGVQKNAVRALELYQKAIDSCQDTNAMNGLAMLLSSGAPGVQQDALRAVQLYEKSIETSQHTGAMNNLANLLSSGAAGVPKNPQRALELYQDAIDTSQDTKAMNGLANILSLGAPGVPQDAPRAVQLYQQAIDISQNPVAMNGLALLLSSGAPGVQRNAPRALKLYEESLTHLENANAIANLGNLLNHSAPGVPQDTARALSLYERAATEYQHTGAMGELAVLLSVGGPGVGQDRVRALALFEEVIRLTNQPLAKVRLAFQLIESGQGVQQDINRAVLLYEEARQQFQESYLAFDLMDILKGGPCLEEPQTDRAIALLNAAAEAGNLAAMGNLAQWLDEGVGVVEQDRVRARELRERARLRSSED